MSTIPEEDTQDSEVASGYLQHADAEFEEILNNMPAHSDFLVLAWERPRVCRHSPL